MLILKQCYNKLFRRVQAQMLLMLILLMGFQVHYTIALQKVMIIFLKSCLKLEANFCNTYAHTFSRYVQTDGKTWKDVSTTINQCCTQ